MVDNCEDEDEEDEDEDKDEEEECELLSCLNINTAGILEFMMDAELFELVASTTGLMFGGFGLAAVFTAVDDDFVLVECLDAVDR